jgi:hypothetical protein
VMEIVKGNFANKKEKKKIYEEKWSWILWHKKQSEFMSWTGKYFINFTGSDNFILNLLWNIHEGVDEGGEGGGEIWVKQYPSNWNGRNLLGCWLIDWHLRRLIYQTWIDKFKISCVIFCVDINVSPWICQHV